MNYWTQQSIEFAGQKNYLDELFKVYPLNPNLRRELSKTQTEEIYSAYEQRDNIKIVKVLLEAELFPLKDSYVPFLRHDREAMTRNPQTVNRIAGNLYQMGLEAIIEKCTTPKETNRQIGPLFRNWIQKNRRCKRFYTISKRQKSICKRGKKIKTKRKCATII